MKNFAKKWIIKQYDNKYGIAITCPNTQAEPSERKQL
jgi:hypothetical protein